MKPKRYRSCILGTCCVPWNENFEFEESLFRRSVRHQIASGIRDLYVFGTAGEGYAVTEGQFDAVTRAFLDETRDEGIQAMVGLISLSLPTIIERIQRARAMGARRFQISLPSWGVLRDSELRTFFRETCGRFPDCEFLHYNLQRSGRLLTGAEYGCLAAEHPNLVATKNSTADEARLRSLLTDAPQLQHFITEFGFLISFTSTHFGRAVDYFQAGRRQDAARIAEIASDFDAVIATLKEAVADAAHMDGAFDKMFCRVQLSDFPLRLLPPYDSVGESAFTHYLELMRQNHPHWLP